MDASNTSSGEVAPLGEAFGSPGTAPTWCSSDKDFVSTALGGARLWVTVGHGIMNEIYWPSTGEPQVRDFGFYLVGTERWIDLKRERRYRMFTPGPAVPLLTIVHYGDDYQLTLEVLPDPLRDVLLVRYALVGSYRLIVILAPHLGSTGRDNSAWIDDGVGYARRNDAALCLHAVPALQSLSCGFVGASDGWQDLAHHGRLTYRYASATNGTVAISGAATSEQGVLALGFADNPRGAYIRARTALAADFQALRAAFLEPWEEWSEMLDLPQPDATLGAAARLSAAMLKVHEDRSYPGGVVASLSIPWGNTTDTLGGYHLVWPRDTTLTAFALLAANQRLDAQHVLSHLIAAQQRDGHWTQNYFPDGEPFWSGIQLDEVGFPVLLAAKLSELGERELPGTRAMIRAAIGFIARTGPWSPQDRWEENPGVSCFTLAVAISALIAAAPWLDPEQCRYALDLANDWNERLESWCYVRDTKLASEFGLQGYYVRISHPNRSGERAGWVHLRNRGGERILASALVSLDFSYLVRLGLRHPHDQRVQDTIRVVDHVLKVETPSGALYHRYNEDGYGEQADGRAFDGQGIGRAWPLLVGERGHLALQAGEDPIEYLRTMWRCSSPGGLLPEQVWDSAAIPKRGLEPGRPSGSAMPLLWAHAEFLKLLVAREHQRPVELLEAVERHCGLGNAGAATAPPVPALWRWRDEVPITRLLLGRGLAIEDRRPFMLHFGFDGWRRIEDREARPEPFGLWSVAFSPAELEGASELNFTRRHDNGWEQVDHRVGLGSEEIVMALASFG